VNDIEHYIFTLKVTDELGLLSRIIQLFVWRGCGITSIHVQPQKNQPFAWISIDAYNIKDLPHVKSRLERLVNVYNVKARKITTQE